MAKTRDTVEHGDARWEIDEFGGTMAGLHLAEVELASESETVKPPRIPVHCAGPDRRPKLQEQDPGHPWIAALVAPRSTL
jgi:hypothetical protein